MKLLVMEGRVQEPADTAWHAQHRKWRHLLDACGQKPSRRRVHALRVVTLRLLSIQVEPGDATMKSPGARTARRWTKQAGRLRHVLGDVRELDVYRSRLASLRSSLEGPDAVHQHLSQEILRQMDKLDGRLKQRRRKAEKKLSAWIADELPQLCEISAALETATHMKHGKSSGQSVAVGIAALTEDFPEPEASNLHELRKRAKVVRYVAEASGAKDPWTRKVVHMLRAMQVLVGTWHDWDALAQEARRMMPGRSAHTHLIPLLDEVAAEWLHKATGGCKRALVQLEELAQSMRAAPAQPKGRRMPVRGAESAHSGVGLQRA